MNMCLISALCVQPCSCVAGSPRWQYSRKKRFGVGLPNGAEAFAKLAPWLPEHIHERKAQVGEYPFRKLTPRPTHFVKQGLEVLQ